MKNRKRKRNKKMEDYTKHTKAELMALLEQRDATIENEIATKEQLEKDFQKASTTLKEMATPDGVIACITKLGKAAKQELAMTARTTPEGYKALTNFMYGI